MTRTWTDQDLIAFQDGETPDPDAEALGDLLRTDAGLRARLAALTSTDDLARDAMSRAFPRRPRRARGWVWPAAAAAVALGALTAIRPTTMSPALPILSDQATDSPVRVVLSLRLEGGATAEPWSEAGDRTDGASTPTSVTDDLDSMVQRLRHGGEAERGVVIDELGETLRSARTARRVLSSMTVDAQLEACERWAAQPHLRPVAFERMRELRREGMTVQVRRVADRLNDDPGLQGWVSSYVPGTTEVRRSQ